MRRNVKYALMQAPGIIFFATLLFFVHDRLSIPPWLAVLLVLVWIGIDAALYPVIGHAYDAGESNASHRMIGCRGVAKERLDPFGYVQMNGELWRAEVRGGGPVEAGGLVEVKKQDGLTLVVEAIGDAQEKTA